MLNEKELFGKWIELGKPEVWIKDKGDFYWNRRKYPQWGKPGLKIVLDGEHAEAQKKHLDNPNKIMQFFNKIDNEWQDITGTITWSTGVRYRIKKEWFERKDMVEKPILCKPRNNEKENIDIFSMYEKNSCEPFIGKRTSHKIARPVEKKDLYQEKPFVYWAEDEDAVGKPIWVRDHISLPWNIKLFKGLELSSNRPFKTTDDGNYKYAKPVKKDEILKGE